MTKPTQLWFNGPYTNVRPLTRSRRWSLQGLPYFQFSTTSNHIKKAHLHSIFLLLDHHKPDWSFGKKRKHKRCYFLELEKVKKEEVDFWTSRLVQDKHVWLFWAEAYVLLNSFNCDFYWQGLNPLKYIIYHDISFFVYRGVIKVKMLLKYHPWNHLFKVREIDPLIYKTIDEIEGWSFNILTIFNVCFIRHIDKDHRLIVELPGGLRRWPPDNMKIILLFLLILYYTKLGITKPGYVRFQ